MNTSIRKIGVVTASVLSVVMVLMMLLNNVVSAADKPVMPVSNYSFYFDYSDPSIFHDKGVEFDALPEDTTGYAVIRLYHFYVEGSARHGDISYTVVQLTREQLLSLSFRGFTDVEVPKANPNSRQWMNACRGYDLYIDIPDSDAVTYAVSGASFDRGTQSVPPADYPTYVYKIENDGSCSKIDYSSFSFDYDVKVEVSSGEDKHISVCPDINSYPVELESDSKVFDGHPMEVTVNGLDGYTRGVDYTVDYDTTAVLSGEYDVTITPVEGHLGGSAITLTYTITELGGYCGYQDLDKVSWILDDANKELIFQGTGEIKNYNTSDNIAPWSGVKDYITKVTVGSGITAIGSASFYRCDKIVSVSLPDTLTSIFSNAFADCSSLAVLDLPESIRDINSCAFLNCSSLLTVTIPQGTTSISKDAFEGCSSINDIYCYAPVSVWEDFRYNNYNSCFKENRQTVCHITPDNYYNDGPAYGYESVINNFNLTIISDMQVARVYGYKATLDDGVIGVDFYVEDLQEYGYPVWDHMLFTYADGTTESVDHYEDVQSVNNLNRGYFTCYTAAKNMNDPIKAQLFDENGPISAEYVFSIAEYADYIYNNPNDFSNGKYNGLIKALLSYGACAQKYFGYNGHPINYSYVSTSFAEDISNQISNRSSYSLGDLKDYAKASSLILNSGTVLKLYFDKASGITNASCGTRNVTVTETDSSIIIKFEDIKWSELGSEFDITVTHAGGETVITVSPMTYVYQVVTGQFSDNLTNLAKSIYYLNVKVLEILDD